MTDNPEHNHDIVVKKCQFCEKENCQRYIKELKKIMPDIDDIYFCLLDTKNLVDSGEFPKNHWKEAYIYVADNIGISCNVDGGFPCTGCIRERIKKLLSDEKELVGIKEKLEKLRVNALEILEKHEKNRKDFVKDDIGAVGFGLDEDQQKHICDLWDWQEQFFKSKIILGCLIEETESSHPYLCFQHGGSPDGEKINKENGFKCPRCEELDKSILE